MIYNLFLEACPVESWLLFILGFKRRLVSNDLWLQVAFGYNGPLVSSNLWLQVTFGYK